jgi:LVIVD repeat
MRFAFRLVVAVIVTLGLLAGTAAAQEQSRNMKPLFQSPNSRTNSDLAFWGDYAFQGYYDAATAGTDSGVRIFDISNPADPVEIKDFKCDGQQNDPILWDRDGSGIPDLMLLAVDRTMESPECGAARATDATGARFDAKPTGWEGVRVFTMSDDPADPFATIEQVKAVYTDCGAHTITAWPEFAHDASNPRLLVYVSSYPLRPGPTCGVTQTDPPPFQNTANPYDEDPGSPNSGLHGVIQTVEVPLNDPAASHELGDEPGATLNGQLPISYPGDPDGKQEWSEKGQPPPPAFEPAAVACHDIVVHVEHRIAGGACAEQGQVWEILPNGLPNTANPMSIGDDEVSSGGTGQFPGAVDFFHSVMFNNDGTVVNWVDESFGEGCPTMTEYEPRPWNPAGGTHKTGRMFFSDMEGNFLSEFHVGDLRPQPLTDPAPYCSAHMGMAVMGIKRDLLVNAWYTGGVDVIDFSNPTKLKEIAYHKFGGTFGSDNWSAYPYTGPLFKKGGGVPVYASDGVEDQDTARGTVVFRARIQRPSRRNLVDHLNPQTMDHEMVMRGGGKDDDDDDRGKSKGRGRGDD